MWAQRLVAPRTFEAVEVPAPEADELADGEVLVRVLAGGVCGSDLPVFKGLRTLYHQDGGEPGSPMHEIVGDVVASRHAAHRPGDRVVGWATRNTGLAEFTVTDGGQLARAAELPPEHAVVAQSVACVRHALETIGDVTGARVAVLGQGPMGLLFDRLLTDAGADVVGIDKLNRVELADRFGARAFVHAHTSRWAADLPEVDRPDIVIEAIGHNVSTVDDALAAVRPGGRIHYYGIPDVAVYPLNMDRLLRKNLTLSAGITTDRIRMLTEATDWLTEHAGFAAEFVTDVVDGPEANRAYRLAADPTPTTGKVTIVLSGQQSR